MLIGLVLIVVSGLLLLLSDKIPSLFTYVLDESGVSILLIGHFRVTRVSFDEIEYVGIEPWSQLIVDGAVRRATYLGVRIFSSPVIIERRNRPALLLAPKKPDAFVAEVRKAVNAQTVRHRSLAGEAGHPSSSLSSATRVHQADKTSSRVENELPQK